MKKKLIYVILTMLTALCAISFTACGGSEPTITSISVTGNSTVCVNDFSLDDYKITITMSDGTTSEVPLKPDYVSADDLALLENAGTHTVTITYQGVSAEYTFVLQKDTFDGITFADKEITYDGHPHSLEITGVPSFASVSYDKAIMYTNAGEYTVTATVSADNYTSQVLTATLKINKATYDMSQVVYKNTEAIYDGTSHTITVDNLPSGVTAFVESTNYVNAGSYQIKVSFTGDSVNYYPISDLTKTLTINKRELKVEFSGNTTIKYDGNAHKTISVVAKNILDGDTVNINLAYGGEMIEKGVYIVTATVNNKNYQLTQNNTVQVEITRELHTVTFRQDGEDDIIYNVYDLATVTETIPQPVQLRGYTTVWEEYDISCVTADKIISAVRTIDTYKITYTLNGATNSPDNLLTFTVLSLPLKLENAINPQNSYFYGWYLDEDFTQKCDEINTLEDLALFARIVEGSDNLEYEVSEDGTYYTLINYTGDDANVYVPKTFNEKPVQVIGEKAFYNKRAIITSVSLPDTITTIESFAFGTCTKLKTILIPSTVTTINANAFNACNSLTIYVSASSKPSGWNSEWNNISRPVFYNVKEIITDSQGLVYAINNTTDKATLCQIIGNLGYIIIPKTINSKVVESVSSACFKNNTTIKTVVIDAGIITIADSMFYCCTNLKSISLLDSVTSIGSYAFSDCSSLTSVTIPDSVTSIGSYAFKGCSSLTSITIPNSVTSIGGDAFENCTSLTSITIGESVTSIGYSAFRGCSSLTSVTIPDSVTSIGDNAFYDCSSLTSVYYGGDNDGWANITIDFNNTPLSSATIYFYSADEPTLNVEGTAFDGNYWRYVDGAPTAWIRETAVTE